MKTKKVTYTHTGEVRKPKPKEWWYNQPYYHQNNGNSDFIEEREIVTRTETFEDWKPKETEVIFFITTTAGSLQVMATNYVEGAWTDGNVKDGNCFPTRELAEQKLTEIKKLLQS